MDHQPPTLRQQRVETSRMYRWLRQTARIMDRYHLDPIIGLVPGGWGDLLSSLLSLPFVWFSLSVVRSVPLALAVICNILGDICLGLIPFYVGNVIDFFSHSYLRNMALVEGFVEGNEKTIGEVRRKAWLSGIVAVLLCVVIIGMIWAIAKFVSWMFS